MEQKGLRSGHFLALVGALAAFGSLWRPWYEISIPQQLRDAINQQVGHDPGLIGQMARSLVFGLPKTISSPGWQELEGADTALSVGAGLVILLILAAGGGFGASVRIDPIAATRAIAATGAAGIALALVHVVHQPAGGEYVHVADGLWIALGGCVAVLAGGLWAAADIGSSNSVSRSTAASPPTSFPPLEPELPAVFAPSPTATPGSVPPPSA